MDMYGNRLLLAAITASMLVLLQSAALAADRLELVQQIAPLASAQIAVGDFNGDGMTDVA